MTTQAEYQNFQIIKVPGINGLGKTDGCERAGNALIETLREIYTNEQGKEISVGKLDLEEIHLDNYNLEESGELIYENAFKSYNKDKVIFLGGDHSISYFLTRAFFDYNQNEGKEPCLIVFDAHPDLMKPSSEFPTHEEWLRKLIEDGFPVENILLVGIRNSDKEEIKFIMENKIKFISMNSFLLNLEDICDGIMEFSNGKELYLSLDIDVVDPAFAPSTGYLETGGLTSRQIIYLMQRISKIKNLRAIDIVEIDSEKDKKNNNLTVKLGAKILSEFL
ncbi:MAG: arginase family protein [Candidatus Pacearchaeota archaeon]